MRTMGIESDEYQAWRDAELAHMLARAEANLEEYRNFVSIDSYNPLAENNYHSFLERKNYWLGYVKALQALQERLKVARHTITLPQPRYSEGSSQ